MSKVEPRCSNGASPAQQPNSLGLISASLADILQRVRDGGGQLPRTFTAETFIDLLQAPDQVEYLAPRVGAARGVAEMGAASEGATLVDHAALGEGVEQGTGSVLPLRQFLPAGRAHRLGGGEGLTQGQHRGPSREPEAAAFRLERAVARGGICRQIGVDLSDCRDGILRLASGIGCFEGIAFAHGKSGERIEYGAQE